MELLYQYAFPEVKLQETTGLKWNQTRKLNKFIYVDMN